MRVLAVLPPDRWIDINILETFRSHYCDHLEVFHYPGGMGQLGNKKWREIRDKLNHELINLAQGLKAAGRLDLVFFMVYDDFLLVDTAKKLRDLQVPMVNYHVDMAFQWYRVIRTAPYFDVLAVAQMTNAEHLVRYNPNIHWMPMAANPDWYSSLASRATGSRHDLSFVGSFNPFRRAHIANCVKHGFNPAVYGRGWNVDAPSPYQFDWDSYKVWHDLRYYCGPRWRAEDIRGLLGVLKKKYARQHVFEELVGPEFHPPCTDESLPAIFRSSKVNFGFSDTGWHGADTVVSSRNLQCRLRDFEVPMSGGFYLVQEAPDHDQYYKIGEEIETWSEPEELIDKLRYFSTHSHAGERIREAGMKRALTSHTWRHRFDSLLKKLGGL